MDEHEYADEVGPEVELPAFAYHDNNDFEHDNSFPSSGAGNEIEPVIRNFLQYFYANIIDQNVPEITGCYDSSWNKLSERFFSNTTWPSSDLVAPLVDNDKVFLILYKELSFRHIYSKLQPTIEQRFASFYNYCDFFNHLLNAETPVQLELPNQWLWDIIDEFIYQFQSFCQFRSKLKTLTTDELAKLKQNQDVWNIHSVLNVLHALIDKSKIQQQLIAAKKQGDISEAAGEFGNKPLYKMLGYFSIIGLLRLHCLLGDYYLALDVISNIELNKRGLFTRVTPCHITLFYYVGFCYVMMRRYQDAARTFSHILYFISRTKHYHTRSFQYDTILKQNEQMYALLAICVSLCPQRVEDSVAVTLKEKQGERIEQVSQGENFDRNFEEWFSYSCPKFISPTIDFNISSNLHKEPFKFQLNLFLREAKQQMLIPTIRSYLKLYTSMDVKKLANFLNITEDELRTALLCYKHKTRQKKWESGSAFLGNYSSLSDINFYLKENMIHVTETKFARRYGDFFIRHISKFDDLLEN